MLQPQAMAGAGTTVPQMSSGFAPVSQQATAPKPGGYYTSNIQDNMMRNQPLINSGVNQLQPSGE